MSVSDETLALIETRDAAYRMLSPKMATLVTNVGNSSYEHGVHYDEDNDEFERVYRRALEDEIALAEAILEIQRKLDAAERRIAELRQWEPDLSLYGKGEPKSLEELKASHDRLLCTCPRNSTFNGLSLCFHHLGWAELGAIRAWLDSRSLSSESKR